MESFGAEIEKFRWITARRRKRAFDVERRVLASCGLARRGADRRGTKGEMVDGLGVAVPGARRRGDDRETRGRARQGEGRARLLRGRDRGCGPRGEYRGVEVVRFLPPASSRKCKFCSIAEMQILHHRSTGKRRKLAGLQNAHKFSTYVAATSRSMQHLK